MKINNLNSQNNILNFDTSDVSRRKSKHPIGLNQAENYNNEYNNIKNGPTRAINFCGSAISSGTSLAEKFIRNNSLNKVVNFVYENEAAYTAIYSLLMAGILKPLFVLNMPGSEEKDKQIVATKNFLQAFIGSFLSLTIGGGFIKKATDLIQRNMSMITYNKKTDEFGFISEAKLESMAKESLLDKHAKSQGGFINKYNLAKETASKADSSKVSTFFKTLTKKLPSDGYAPTAKEIQEEAKLLKKQAQRHLDLFKEHPDYIKKLKDSATTGSLIFNKDTECTLMDAYTTCWKNSTGWITSIAKAKISSILLPSVMAALFAKKNIENKMKAEKERQEKEGLTLINSAEFQKDKANFPSFFTQENKGLSFKGSLMDSAIDNLAYGVEKLSMTKAGQGVVGFLSKFKKQSARMSDVESGIITAYWVQNTARSKKIDPDQKLGLNIHTILVTVVSSTCAFLIDEALDGAIKKTKNKYHELFENALKNDNLDNIKDVIGGKKFISKVNKQNSITELALKLAEESPEVKSNKTGIAASLFKEASANELKENIEQAESLRDLAKAIKKLNDGNLKDKIEALIQDSNIKGANLDVESLAKNASVDSILKQLADSINLDLVKEASTKYGKQLKKAKSLTVFTLVVRFLVPVLMVPISGKLKKKFIEMTAKKDKDSKKV